MKNRVKFTLGLGVAVGERGTGWDSSSSSSSSSNAYPVRSQEARDRPVSVLG